MSVTSATPIVELTRVSKAYVSAAGVATVLRDVDLIVEAGEKVSLMGPSGSGKSTLLSLIAGLLRADAGAIEVDGVALNGLDDGELAQLRARRVGIVRQSGNLIPFLTALENVDLALGFAQGGADGIGALDLLDRMGVAHRANHVSRRLSGGEAQRVALSVAVANAPALLLADEMVSALDSASATAIVDRLFASEMAVLFVTHDAALADRADRRLRLHDHEVSAR